MPGAETRNLGSEGPVHVSVAGWVVGAMVHVGTGLGAGGDLGRRNPEPWRIPTEQELSLLPRALGFGEPCTAVHKDDRACFMKKNPNLQGHLW